MSSAYSHSNSTSHSSSSERLGFGDRILAPLGFALLVLVVIVLSYLFVRRRQRLPIHSNQSSDSATAEAEAAATAADDDDDDDDSSVAAAELSGLSEATILSYPMLLYAKAKQLGGELTAAASSCCSICLADYRDSDVLRFLPECDHCFHSKCVDPWLKLHSSCPICRKSLINP